MKVSVVVCTYSLDLHDHLVDAVESVRSQRYDDVEVVLVVDGNEELYERVEQRYGDCEDVTLHLNEENVGLSQSRNNALRHVTGDIVALLDDDAVADPGWIEELVSGYDRTDAIAVGGRMAPEWVAGRPAFLPEEFYWLVGVTHRGFGEAGEEVRNTFGSNISFRREVLETLGGFDPEVGRRGDANVQAEETVLCARMREEFGRGVLYVPDAVVAHKVFEFRTRPRWLLERAFWQGYSKRAMRDLVPAAAGGEESRFLRDLLFSFGPERLRDLLTSPTVPKAKRFVALWAFTAAVGFGYLYGTIKYR
jgi:glucosyl-dolichyl phosphate glucuronosyltransferase